MDTNPTNPILESAWKHYAEMDTNASDFMKRHLNMRRWVAILGVVATLLAILVNNYADQLPVLVGLGLKFFLFLTPIVGSVVAAIINKFYSGGGWLTMRAGAEEILKDIYLYRTVFQRYSARRKWMTDRLASIQRQVYKGLSGELVLKPYKGSLPPYYTPGDTASDPGFVDLTGDEYVHYRLEPQLNWHNRKVGQYQRDRTRLQWVILAMGGAGALLAAMSNLTGPGMQLAVWVALTAALASAFSGWDNLRNLDAVVKNYSKVVLELTILRDHWLSMDAEERTQQEFYKIVRSTEDILWSQNVEYIKAMQEALASAQEEEALLVEQALQEQLAADAEAKRQLNESIVARTREALEAAEDQLLDTFELTMDRFAEEAASDEVARELQAVGDAIATAFQSTVSSLNRMKQQLADEFSGVVPGRDTPKETLNEILARFPAQGEGKG